MAIVIPGGRTKEMESDKDEAIHELAHVATQLLEFVKESGKVPEIFTDALQNKIDFYEGRASQ